MNFTCHIVVLFLEVLKSILLFNFKSEMLDAALIVWSGIEQR
jgi:hypothetical protein